MNITLYSQKERNGKYFWFDEEGQLAGKLTDLKFTFLLDSFKKRVIRHCMINQIKLEEIGEDYALLTPNALKKLHRLSGI